MKHVLSALALVALLCGPAQAAEKFLVFVNQTDQEIKEVHLAPAGSGTWGPNLLKEWKLHPGRNINVSVPHDEGNCKWDLKYVVRERMMYVIKDLNICQAVEIEIFNQDGSTWVNIK